MGVLLQFKAWLSGRIGHIGARSWGAEGASDKELERLFPRVSPGFPGCNEKVFSVSPLKKLTIYIK